MRLLFVSHSFPPAGRLLANIGGMQRVATELDAALHRHPGAELETLALRTSWTWTHVRTPFFLARAYRHIRRHARQEPAPVVLFSSMVTAALAPLLRRRHPALVLAAIVHGRDVTLPAAPYQRLVPRIFAALDAVLPVSRATGAQCAARGMDEEKIHVVPNGIDLARIPPPPDRTAARRALGAAFPEAVLPEGALLLCSVGRQVERKGFAWFVDAVLPRLPTDVHYWLAGDGPERGAIEAAAARHGLAERVRLLGRVSEEALAALYRGADLFVMPNIPVRGDMEGFGVVMLEAGLGGLPVVAARLEGIRDVITEGANGHLVESGDAEAFAAAITRYHGAPQRLASAAARARNHVVQTFGWDAVAQQYVSVLNTIAGASHT
ncbi:MAG: glycosyltransferase family 4 protein [Rhodothermales bacterium]|nr:glycosyltransferase family 4 protein [Rhodothermales bacterium]